MDRSGLPEPETLGEVLLDILEGRGLEVFLANAGTDFASLIEAFVKRKKRGVKTPRPLAVAHETALTAMAHGYYLATGKPAAAMVHVGIGTANALGPLMAASRAKVPILFLAGKTPVTEEGHPGSRSASIHWGQDVYDQAASVREWVKWSYELRRGEELTAVIDRALTLAQAQPQGPVYLALPRADPSRDLRQDLPAQGLDQEGLARAASWMAQAENPLIITTASGREPQAVVALGRLAEAAGAAVVCFNPEYLNLPRSHPCHQGFDPHPLVAKADVILVVESASPWYPKRAGAAPGARVIQLGREPLHACLPMRSFPSDLTLQAGPAQALEALAQEMENHPQRDREAVAGRMKELKNNNQSLARKWAEEAEQGADQRPLSPAWVSSRVGRVLKDWVLFNEYYNSMTPFAPEKPGGFFATPHAGFLGWGLGASLGYKLGRPEAKVALTVGDGSYIFAAPTACHLFSATHGLPTLTVVHSNAGYNAVRQATREVHPKGHAVSAGHVPLTELGDTSRLHKVVEACGGHGETVDTPEQLDPALERAVKAVVMDGKPAVVNVMVSW